MTTSDEKNNSAQFTLSRREFLDGASATLGVAAIASISSAAATTAAQAATQVAAAVDAATPPMNSTNYPPGLQGLRGQPVPAREIPHAIRDGGTFEDAADTKETYDLIVVGAGVSGLAAAYFYKKKLPRARILVLEAADDFGGTAKRTEFVVKGKRFINPGGALGVQYPGTYTPEGKSLLTDIGVNSKRYFASAKEMAAQKKGPRVELDDVTFFDRETWGSDVLVRSTVEPYVVNRRGLSPIAVALTKPAEIKAKWSAFLKDAPLSDEVKRDTLRMMIGTQNYMAGASLEEKIKRLKGMTYRNYLINVVGVTPDVFKWLQEPMSWFWSSAAGPETYSAWAAYVRGMAGFQGLGLPTSVHTVADYLDDEDAGEWIIFPDGLYTVSRLLIRWLNPEALPGTTQEDSIRARFDYDALDKPGKPVRIRLNSPVVSVRHVGSPATAEQVEVAYVHQGRPLKVRGAAVVMACYNAMIPYICPELPEEQKAALRLSVRTPVMMTTLVLNNWRAFAKARVNYMSFPTMPGLHWDIWGPRGGLEVPCLGVDQRVTDPDEPVVITAWSSWKTKDLPPRANFRAERQRHHDLTEEDYRKDLEIKLHRVLGAHGFNADRDMDGMIANRFPHGLAGGMNSLYDPEPTRHDQEPRIVARKRFNLITIANSDASGVALTQNAIDQANRAVNEIVQTLVQPQPDYDNAARI